MEENAPLKYPLELLKRYGRFRTSAKWFRRLTDSIVELEAVSEESIGGPRWAKWEDKYFQSGLNTRSLPLHEMHKFPFTLDKLETLTQVSVVGRRLYASRMLSEQGLVELTADNAVGAAQCFAAAYRLDDLPIQWNLCRVGPAIQTFQRLADSTEGVQVRADACLVLCFLYSLTRNANAALRSLKLGQQLSPEDEALFFAEGNLQNSLGNHELSAAALDRSIELGNSHEALFVHGCVVQTLGTDGVKGTSLRQAARKSLGQYICCAPPEERKVCEAYYHLAVLEMCESNFGAAKRHYDKGVVAEKNRLPCYDDKPSSFRRRAGSVLATLHACGNSECSKLGFEVCAGCRSIRYCSQECQKSHWKQHKQACRAAKKKKKKK